MAECVEACKRSERRTKPSAWRYMISACSRELAATGTEANGRCSQWYSASPATSVVLPLPSGTTSQHSGEPEKTSSTNAS